LPPRDSKTMSPLVRYFFADAAIPLLAILTYLTAAFAGWVP